MQDLIHCSVTMFATLTEHWLLSILLLINVVTFCAFGVDKFMAVANHWRISEKMLWFLSLIGGSAGALLAMHTFRHKTKKIEFQLMMFVILLIQAGLVYLYITYVQ